MNRIRRLCQFAAAAVAACIWFAGDNRTSASVIAFDSASDPEYVQLDFPFVFGWEDDDNGGFGFERWDLDGEFGSHFIFTSTSNGDGDSNMDGDIDTAGGRAFALSADTSEFVTVSAQRAFAAALEVGQTFSLDMDNGFIDSGDAGDFPRAGFSLMSTSGDRFAFFASAGDDNYTVFDGNGQRDTGIPLTDEGLSIAVTLISPGAYSLSINGTQALLGDLALSGPITEFSLGTSAGSAAANDVYFNNFAVTAAAVVPEPAWAGAACMALAALVAWLRNSSRFGSGKETHAA